MLKPLREYQQTAKDNLRSVLMTGKQRVVLYAPTGSGKSILAVDLIKSILDRGKRVAFVANRVGLVRQFSQHLVDAGIFHGIIQGDNTISIHASCIVCSIQTLGRRGLPQVDFVIVDECHAVPGSKEYKDLMFRHRVNWIGLTATPFAKGMAKHYIELNGTLFQDMVIAATIRELIDQGSLVDCDIYAPNDPDLTGVKLSRNAFGEMDYNDKQLGEAVDKHELIGDIVKHWFKLAKDKKTVVFATNVNHSKHIVEQFKHHGIKAEHIDGYMTQEEKQPILERFISGETLIISNVAMLKEGWDVPECEVMILAKPTKSLIAWVQMVGRILRPFAEKTHGIVLDHSGSVARLGYPTDDLPLQLCDGTEKKASKEREKPKEHKCPKCHFVKKSRICPKCGFEPELKLEIEVIDGELTKLERFSKADKQTWYSQLLAYAHNKGYSRGWVSHKYREKFGVWPKSLIERVEQPSSDVLGWLLHKQIAYAKSQEKVQRRVKEEPEHDIGKLGMLKQMIRGNHA